VKLVPPIPAPLVAQLRTHRRCQNAERLAAGAAWEDWDLVFCSPAGAPLDPHDDWEDWHALLTAAGVREARVHDAHHTAGTLLLEQGIDIRVVQQILGHSQLSQTQRYTHVSLELTQHAADRMEEGPVRLAAAVSGPKPYQAAEADAKGNCNQNCNHGRITMPKPTVNAQVRSVPSSGAPGARTLNPRIKSPLLCH